MRYTVVRFGDGHWEAKIDGESMHEFLGHYEDLFGGCFGGDVAHWEPNRYSTRELAIRSLDAARRDEERRQELRDKDTRDRMVMEVIEI